jgi:hypothetical protein
MSYELRVLLLFEEGAAYIPPAQQKRLEAFSKVVTYETSGEADDETDKK